MGRTSGWLILVMLLLGTCGGLVRPYPQGRTLAEGICQSTPGVLEATLDDIHLSDRLMLGLLYSYADGRLGDVDTARGVYRTCLAPSAAPAVAVMATSGIREVDGEVVEWLRQVRCPEPAPRLCQTIVYTVELERLRHAGESVAAESR